MRQVFQDVAVLTYSIKDLRVYLISGVCRKKFRGVQGYGRPRKGSGKNQKCIFQAYFSKNSTNHALIFRWFGENHKFLGNFEKVSKIFKKFLKKSKNALF